MLLGVTWGRSRLSLLLILGELLHPAKASSPPGADKTDLATRRRHLAHRTRATDVLVVTSSEGMLHGILRHTPDLGPAVALHGVLVVGPPGLEQGLVRAAASGDDPDLRPHAGRDGLLPPRGEAEAGRALVLVVGYHDREAPRAAGEGAAVAHARLHVADDGSLRDLLQRQDVPDGERRLLTAVHELAGVHALGRDHELHVALEAVGVEELDLGHGGASSGVVEDLLDDAADVTAPLGVVDGSELHGSLAGAHVRLEDGGLTLTLGLLTSSRRGEAWDETNGIGHALSIISRSFRLMASHRG